MSQNFTKKSTSPTPSKAPVLSGKEMSRVFGSKATSAVNLPTARIDRSVDPEKVSCTFKDDFNIMLVHQRVRAHFQKEQASLQARKDKLAQLQWIRDNSTTVAEKKMATLEIQAVETIIHKLESKSEESSYDRQTMTLLEEYQALVALKSNRVFGVKKVVDDNTELREQIIVMYLSIARRYVDVNVVLDTRADPCCSVCKSPLVEGLSNCTNCPAFIAEFEIESSYKDSDRNNAPSRNNYVKSDHIRDALIKFQGKQPNKVPADLISDLENTVAAYGIKTKDLKIDTLYQILRDKKYSTHYDDIYLIYHIITHKPLPNLDDIQAELFRDAELFASIYHEIKPPTRLNCLNAHFIRDVLLRRVGRDDPEWHCTTLRTDLVSVEHNSTMERAFARLNWGPYKPL
jgi:hypothetical protein